MNDQVAELARLSLALSQDDRARLTELLLYSLDAEPKSDVEAAWDEEIRQRLAAYDRSEERQSMLKRCSPGPLPSPGDPSSLPSGR